MRDLLPKNMQSRIKSLQSGLERYRAATKPRQCPPEKKLTIGGETLTVREWSDRYGVRRGTIFERLYRGWPPEQAVMPLDRKYRLEVRACRK